MALAHDYSSIYSRQGGFLAALILHSQQKALQQTQGEPASGANAICDRSVLVVEATGLLAEQSVLSLIRCYCHTGCLLIPNDATSASLLLAYRAAHCYGLPCWQPALCSAIMQRSDAASVLTILDTLWEHGLHACSLSERLQQYVAAHPHEVLRRTGSSVTGKLHFSTLEGLLHILSQDCTNANEDALMEDVYAFCSRRARGDLQTAAALFLGSSDRKEVINSPSPVNRKRPRSDSSSSFSSCPAFWSCIRPSGLTVGGILGFRNRHPGTLADSMILDLLHESHLLHATGGPEMCRQEEELVATNPHAAAVGSRSQRQPPYDYKCRRHLQQCISVLDLSLRFPKTDGPASAVITQQEPRQVVIYVAVALTRNGNVELPPLPAAGGSVLVLRLSQTPTHAGASISLNPSVVHHRDSTATEDTSEGGTMDDGIICPCAAAAAAVAAATTHLTVDLLNLKREKVKRLITVDNLEHQHTHTLHRIVTLAALQAEGQTFDPASYPVIAPGGRHNLLRIQTTIA